MTAAPRLRPESDMRGSLETISSSRNPVLLRALRGAAVGGTLVGLVLLARRLGLLQGETALVLLTFACLLVPVSRQLSRRILLTGAAGLGWVPMLWWFPAPLPSLGRISMLLALLLGGLGAWVASGCSTRARLASLVPHLRPVDVLPFITAIASAAAMRDLLTARTGSRVLTLLIPGWDNISHYAMVHMIRESGVVTNAAPWITAEAWPFTHYPQGFHSAVAATMELLTSPTVGSVDHELVVYAHAEALVVIVAVTALAAGICALPRLRRRPALTAPLVTLVSAGFITGPGYTSLQDGFPNFVVGCALVGMVVLLIIPLGRVISPVVLGAIAGAIVGIAYDWTLIVVLALLALPALAVPLSRTRWRASRGRRLASTAILLAVALSLFAVVHMLSVVPISQLASGGGVTPPGIGILITIVVGSAALTLAVLARARTARDDATGGKALSTGALVLIPLGGMAIAAAIAVFQLRTTTTIGYYFWKFAIGLELACLVVIVAAVAALATVRPQGSSTRLSRTIVAASSVLLVFAASQSFGYVGPALARYGVPQGDSTSQTRELTLRQTIEPNPTGERLLAAVHVQERDPNLRVLFLPYPQDVRTHHILAEQWFLALTGTYTDKDTEMIMALQPMNSPQLAAAWATGILREDPTRVVVVGPDVLGTVREAMDPAIRDRIVGW